MDVELDHPAISGYLSRLAAAASGLSPGRRDELLAEIRSHLSDALASAQDGDDAAVYAAVDRLGDPHDIVAAEGVEPGFAAQPGYGVRPQGSAPPRPTQLGGGWGPVEVVAMIGLALGSFTLGLGVVVGLVCTWISTRWKTSEKLIATALSLLGLLIVPVLALGLITTGESIPTESGPAPQNQSTFAPADPAPALDPVGSLAPGVTP